MDTTVLFDEPEELDFSGSVWRTADGGFVTSSRKVAEYFGKNHQHILEAIREKRSVENSTHLWFFDSTYKDSYGRDQKEVLMNQSGFMYIAMGFTGAKADQIKIGYINEFEKMRETIQNQLPDFTDPNYVRSALVALDTLMAQNKQLKLEIKEQEPKVNAYDGLMDCKDGREIEDVSKLLGFKATFLRQYLKNNKYIYQNREGDKEYSPYAKYREYFTMKVTPFELPDGTKKMSKKLLILPAGIVHLHSKFSLSTNVESLFNNQNTNV